MTGKAYMAWLLITFCASVIQRGEELADQVWEAWDKREIGDFWAAWAWWTIAQNKPERPLSASCNRRIICASLNRLPFIGSSSIEKP